MTSSIVACKYCNGNCIKKGRYMMEQKYQCKVCFKYQRVHYKYKKLSSAQYDQIKILHNEGVGLRSISRILKVSVTSIQRSIVVLSKKCEPMVVNETGQEYEVDELCTYVKNKNRSNYKYIAYAINRKTREVIDFVIGRSKEQLNILIGKLLSFKAKKIYTDNYGLYKCLIPSCIHYSYENCINRIERNNLTMRVHLKRLNRATICFSRSVEMLKCSLQLYFFG